MKALSLILVFVLLMGLVVNVQSLGYNLKLANDEEAAIALNVLIGATYVGLGFSSYTNHKRYLFGQGWTILGLIHVIKPILWAFEITDDYYRDQECRELLRKSRLERLDLKYSPPREKQKEPARVIVEYNF